MTEIDHLRFVLHRVVICGDKPATTLDIYHLCHVDLQNGYARWARTPVMIGDLLERLDALGLIARSTLDRHNRDQDMSYRVDVWKATRYAKKALNDSFWLDPLHLQPQQLEQSVDELRALFRDSP